MISKQSLLGLGLVFGGGILLYALGTNTPKPEEKQPQPAPAITLDNVARPTVEPLVKDNQENPTQSATQTTPLVVQQLPAPSSTSSNSPITNPSTFQDTRTSVTTPAIQARPDALAAHQNHSTTPTHTQHTSTKNTEKRDSTVKTTARASQAEIKPQQRTAHNSKKSEPKSRQETHTTNIKATNKKTNSLPSKHKVVRGDTLIKLSRRYNIPVSAIAQANNMEREDTLPLGTTIKIPSANQVAKLQKEARQKEAQKLAAAKADERLRQARQDARHTDSTARFGVQVALADNQAKADELVKQFKTAGYKAQTSQTTRGVRVLIGSERSQEAAIALRDKLINDSRVNAQGAWVKRIQ